MDTVTELARGIDVVVTTDPGTACFTQQKEKKVEVNSRKTVNSIRRHRIKYKVEKNA